MVTEALATEQIWRSLWSHTAEQIISTLPHCSKYERIAVGPAWGFRSMSDPSRALLLHPTGTGRETGDLSLTVRGEGTVVLPRCGMSYIEYLDAATNVASVAASAYL